MARRTFQIELKIDLPDDDPRVDALKNLAARFAHDLLAAAALFSDGKRRPQVALLTEDSFMDTEEVQYYVDDNGEVSLQQPEPIEDPSIDDANKDALKQIEDALAEEVEAIVTGKKSPIEV